jgi:hypothetical protein
MALTFKDKQDEVKRRSVRDQGGSQFDIAIKNSINASLFRISREAPWRSMRRATSFPTVTSYSTGSGSASVTSNGTTVNVLGATFLTSNVNINRKVKFSGSGHYYDIAQISGETSMVLDLSFSGSTSTANTYEILPQAEYNLPIQCGHRMFIWHEEYGTPTMLEYIPEQEFIQSGYNLTEKNIPSHYRMWGENMVIKQVTSPTTISVFSTSNSDTNKPITIFGNVGGYPDYEIINTNGTTVATGTKVFQLIERVSKDSSTTGRVTVCSSASTSNIFSVLPVGDTTAGIQYRKIQLYPLPTSVFNMQVRYYKDPYRLVNDGDVHELGQEFDEAIILLSVAKIKMENSQAEASSAYELFKEELKTLRRTNMDKIDWFPSMKRDINSYTNSSFQYRQAGSLYGRTGY